MTKHIYIWISVLLFLLVFYPSVIYAQIVTPPPTAVPEGNVFTAAAFVGSGLYLLWLKGRKRK